MTTYAEKKALRDQGLTYREIGKQLGISYQAVYSGLYIECEGDYFREQTKQTCVFHGLREWMNENRVGLAELCRRIGDTGKRTTYSRIRKALRGYSILSKNDIDEILRVTGMKYEEVFGGAEDGN